MENYKFSDFERDLDKGYQFYLEFVNNKYLVYKTSHNCYTQELIDYNEKNPQPRHSIITHRRLKEIFKFSTELEYKQ